MNNQRQKNTDILQFNQREAMNKIEIKKLEKLKRQEEERSYLDRINLELTQEKSNQHAKKQQMMDQNQKNYTEYANQAQAQGTQSLRKKNSKLMELNTFKIGGEVREIKKKNYQEMNDNLTLNPTRSNNILNSNYNPTRYVPQANNYNIITNNNAKDFSENPMNHTSNEYKQMINNDNFDQYGRQVGAKQKIPNEDKGPSYGGNNAIQGANNNVNNNMGNDIPDRAENPQQVKGIENLENYSPYYDHYNYRPVSGSKPPENNQMSNYSQGGYVQDKGVKPSNPNPDKFPSYYERNPYENYKIEPMNQGGQGQPPQSQMNQPSQPYRQIPEQGPQSQNQSQSHGGSAPEHNQHQGGNPNQAPKGTGKKVDLNNLPIPDSVTTVEDYERYLVSLGIDPLTLEYKDQNSMESLENQFDQMNINKNIPSNEMNKPQDKQIEKIRQDYGYQNPPKQGMEQQGYGNGYNPINQEQEYKGYQQQQSNQIGQQPPQQNSKPNYENMLPNYGAKPLYKNQSSIVIADASQSNRGNPVSEKRDYEPFVKSKPLVINPYSNKNYNFGESSLSSNPITNPINNNSNVTPGKNYHRISNMLY